MRSPPANFGDISPTWEAAGQFVEQWVPGLSGCADSRFKIKSAKKLLQAIVLHYRLTRPAALCNRDEVEAALMAATRSFSPLFHELSSSKDHMVVNVAIDVAANIDDPWYGGVGQALMCLPK